MLVTWVARPISATPVIRPSPAVISGMPAASSEPKVSIRMMNAATTPTAVGGPDAEALGGLDHLPAGGDRQALDVDLVDRIQQGLAGVIGQQVRALV